MPLDFLKKLGASEKKGYCRVACVQLLRRMKTAFFIHDVRYALPVGVVSDEAEPQGYDDVFEYGLHPPLSMQHVFEQTVLRISIMSVGGFLYVESVWVVALSMRW